MLRAAQAGAAGVYNVATGTQTTLAQLVAEVRCALDVPAEPVWGSMAPRAWDAAVWCGDPGALAADLGWRAPVDMPQGVRRTLEWLRANPRWAAHYEARILRGSAVGGGSR